ncbi:MAG TPA: hypothetical protein VHX65_12320 [Pirellulales bacterium]|nr:hypothetical protein [Pirellulales bacterium]
MNRTRPPSRDCPYWGLLLLLAVGLLASASNFAIADSAAPAVKTETVVAGLDTPLAVVVRPNGGDLFVSESGAGRVVRIVPGKDAKPLPAITGFPVGQAPDLPELRAGPLGLAFFPATEYLVVGSGGEGPGKDAVRLFSLPANNKPLSLDDAKKVLTIQPDSHGEKPEAQSATGESWFYAVAAASTHRQGTRSPGATEGSELVPYAIFATSHGDAGGLVSRAWTPEAKDKHHEMIFAPLRPLIATAKLAHTGNPSALVISKRNELVVGEGGKLDKSPDSSLSFYNPSNGKLLLNLPTGLLDIAGLAYSPQTGLLYAVDAAWADAAKAGLYRLDASESGGEMGVKAVKITSLDRPTALCFAPDGVLYVTILGPARPADAKPGAPKTGQLLKITGGL